MKRVTAMPIGLRFPCYLALQAALLALPGPWLALPAALTLTLGWTEGMSWLRWSRSAWPVLLVAAAPAAFGVPLSSLLAGDLPEALAAWLPSLARSARLALVFAAAAWLSRGMSPADLRDALVPFLRPLGRRASGHIARGASLTLAFLPWTLAEARQADEAARLRGSDPRRRPLGHLAAMALPVSVRTLEKARRGAEALTLRDAAYGE